MAERYGRGLYVDAHAAEIIRQKEPLKHLIMKKEEKRARKEEKKETYKRRNTSVGVGRIETTRGYDAT